MRKISLIACWVLLGAMVCLFVLGVSPLRNLLRLSGDFRNFTLPLGILGILLVILVLVTKMSRWLRDFLITAGTSAFAWPFSLYLHNLLFPIFPAEPVTFILFFYILPVTFVIGTLGAIAAGIVQLASKRAG